MLRIQKSADGRGLFSLSGRMDAEDIRALRDLIAREPDPDQIVLDLKELVQVDSDTMEFLAECETKGVVLRQCPRFVRTWIEQWRAESEESSPSPETDSAVRKKHAQRRMRSDAGIRND